VLSTNPALPLRFHTTLQHFDGRQDVDVIWEGIAEHDPGGPALSVLEIPQVAPISRRTPPTTCRRLVEVESLPQVTQSYALDPSGSSLLDQTGDGFNRFADLLGNRGGNCFADQVSHELTNRGVVFKGRDDPVFPHLTSSAVQQGMGSNELEDVLYWKKPVLFHGYRR